MSNTKDLIIPNDKDFTLNPINIKLIENSLRNADESQLHHAQCRLHDLFKHDMVKYIHKLNIAISERYKVLRADEDSSS